MDEKDVTCASLSEIADNLFSTVTQPRTKVTTSAPDSPNNYCALKQQDEGVGGISCAVDVGRSCGNGNKYFSLIS
jgi:hypothetical protein